jgi:succinyl-CoA synthetase beta subunit
MVDETRDGVNRPPWQQRAASLCCSAVSYTLSEHESKRLLAEAGIQVPREVLVDDVDGATRAAEELGYPVVLKLCGRDLAHKTERHYVRLELTGTELVREQAADLLERRESDPEATGAKLLVAPMVEGRRELICGMMRDPQFGPCVMLGLGGIFAELVGDAALAVAPLSAVDADDMIDALQYGKVLGAFRGEPPVDRAMLTAILETLGEIGLGRPEVLSIDINPLIVVGDKPVVVDALVELEGDA